MYTRRLMQSMLEKDSKNTRKASTKRLAPWLSRGILKLTRNKTQLENLIRLPADEIQNFSNITSLHETRLKNNVKRQKENFK